MDALEKLKKYMLVDGFSMILDLQKSKGCRLHDKKSGKTYLDFFSFFASSPIGFNHPEMVSKEFLDKLAYVSVNKPSSSDFYTDEMADFVDTFGRIGIPSFLPNLFLISGGALAVENALKASFDWKVRKNFEKGIEKEVGSKIIHFEQAFHGRSGYTLSLTNTFDPRKTKYFPKFDWPRVLSPTITFPLDKHLDEIKQAEEKSLNQINASIDKYGNDIAGILIEPIQSEGGDNHIRKEFFEELRKIADENEVLLIYDEIQTGIGMTGKFWCYEHFGEKAKPDIISFGKKMQVSGILASNRIKEVENNVFEESSRINSTFGGNLVDMVRAQKYLEIIEKEDLVDKSDKNGSYMLNHLFEIQNDFPELISNTRGKGLMIAFDLPSIKIRDDIQNKAMDKQLMILACGEKTIRFRPALNIEKDEIDEGLNILKDVLKTF